MAKASSSVELAVPAHRVWHLIGGFGSLPDWLPYIPKSELHEGGRTRPSFASNLSPSPAPTNGASAPYLRGIALGLFRTRGHTNVSIVP